ncbi:MAG TPA: hypothetical protein VEA59_06150 [Patescibacteria group bacterium]|nr:hypothetical protein [Patescibacteria group bacterium]
MAKKISDEALQRLFEDEPERVIGILLKSNFWPQSISPGVVYQSHDDDTQEGTLSVLFHEMGDGFVDIISKPDPNEGDVSHRYRTMFGGGRFLRVLTALKILALAIKLDKESPIRM